ncbi:MAG: thioredoxin domain-containing protein, partial [Ktedonobacterales bacterium]
ASTLDVAATGTEVDPTTLTQAANGELASADRTYGGFGGAPKFPHPLGLAFLLRMQTRRRSGMGNDSANGAAFTAIDPDLLDLVTLTLDRMAAGGIYDQIGGGFHRYATDAIWLVPHFEKMLYDNALLAPVYLHAWQLTGNPRYREVCEATLDYTLREMTDKTGAFYSTQDADSEGEEGKFYIWSPAELRAALGDEQSAVVERLWGVSARGNFEGRNILHLARTEAEVASETGHTEAEVHEIAQGARATLYQIRAQRVWPGLDDKTITAWNALMLRAFAEAADILDRDDYHRAAIANADFLIGQMRNDSGRLLRTWRLGVSKGDAYLEDYAALVNGLLSVYALTGESRYFRVARERADEMIARFWDEDAQSFYDTASDAEQLIGRPRELTDNATPAGSSLAAEALLRLAAYTGEARYHEYAARVLVPLAPLMAKHPSGFGQFLCALDNLIGPLYEVALIGAHDDAGTQALRAALRSHYLPRLVFAQVGPGDDIAQAAVPLLANRPLVEDRAALYVCQGFVCQQPVTTPDEALALLKA